MSASPLPPRHRRVPAASLRSPKQVKARSYNLTGHREYIGCTTRRASYDGVSLGAMRSSSPRTRSFRGRFGGLTRRIQAAPVARP